MLASRASSGRTRGSSLPRARGEARRRTKPPRDRVLRLLGPLLAAVIAAPACAQRLTEPEPLEVPIRYFIAAGDEASGYRSGDHELALAALDAWRRAADGAIELEPADEASATLRIYWVPAAGGLYGEMRPIRVDGRRGAEVFVRPDTEALGPEIAALARTDPLFRDSVVYLTCVHEIGHALGLLHTDDERDVMYFFGYGGDVPAFFRRYRSRLGDRDDIATEAGLSAGDVAALRRLYPRG